MLATNVFFQGDVVLCSKVIGDCAEMTTINTQRILDGPDYSQRVEVKRYGALKLRMRAAGMQTWRYGVLVARCRRADAEVRVWSSGSLEARCRRRDVEVLGH